MATRPLPVLCAAWLAFACAGAPHVERPVEHACDEASRFTSFEGLVDVFGPPLSHTTEALPNRHVPGQLDEAHIVAFAGAEARFLVLGSEPPAFHLGSLRVHAQGDALDTQEWLGTTSESFLRAAGPPDRSTDALLLYACNENDEFGIEVQDSLITALVWLPYVD